MCVHVGQSALLQCEKLPEFKQGSDLFSEALQRCAHILQPGLPTLSQSRPAAADVPLPAFVPFTQTQCQHLFQHGSDPFRVSASSPNQHTPPLPLSTLRDIFRAVSQILPYIGAYITAQPAVVQDAGLY